MRGDAHQERLGVRQAKLPSVPVAKRKKAKYDPHAVDEYGIEAWEYRTLEPRSLRARVVELIEDAALEAVDAADEAEGARGDAVKAVEKGAISKAEAVAAKATAAAERARDAGGRVEKLADHRAMELGFVPEMDGGDPTFDEEEGDFEEAFPSEDEGGSKVIAARREARAHAASATKAAEDARAAVIAASNAGRGPVKRQRDA